MKKGRLPGLGGRVFILLLSLPLAACGGGGYGGNGGGGGGSAPSAPTGLTATAGTGQVALSWSASTGATGYHVKRSTTSGGPYSQVAGPTSTSYADTSVNAGTPYYYVVSALNASGESANSAQASATPAAATTGVTVNVNVLTDRHSISPLVYGVNFPNDPNYVQNSGATMVRWGGNAATPYNWTNFDTNASADWYFENRPWDSSASPSWPVDSVQYVTAAKSAGAAPIMTIGMLPWVAKDGLFNSISFSISKYAYSACQVNPFYSDDGDGTKAPCGGNTTNYVTGNDPHDAYVPLLDGPPQAGDPAGSVYRNQWVSALASAFGNTSNCAVPYFSNASCHFYNMDNEIDIWGGTHRDIHPLAAGYNELRDTFLAESRAVKGWDPLAVRFGPVSCCWFYYWNLNSSTDNKSTHANMDFLPWWLNEVYWQDQIAGSRSLDAFDVHAYTDVDPSQLTLANQKTLATSITQDWWNPTFTTPAWFGTNSVTSLEAEDSIPFRIPRMRAMLNAIYPGTPLSITEWNFAMAGGSPFSSQAAEADFTTALADADAWGILGRERVTYSTRWTAADPANAAYQALKLYRNYDGAKHSFNQISVSATHSANPALFSVFASTNAGGSSLTLVVVNKDPGNAAQTTLNLSGFTPSQVTAYTLSPSSPTSIVAGSAQAWPSNGTIAFPPYTATLLVIPGTTASQPAAEWDLNPDTIAMPANGSVILHPRLVSGSASLTLSVGTFDSGITPTITGAAVSSVQQGAVQVVAGGTPGFYHFNIQASDGTTQGGWIVVNKPAAGLSKSSGDGQTGTAGTQLSQALAVTLSPGQSGGTPAGATVLFSTSAGTISNGTSSGSKVVAITNASGVASVKLTLPGTAQPVQVLAEAPYPLGHPTVAFTETAQ